MDAGFLNRRREHCTHFNKRPNRPPLLSSRSLKCISMVMFCWECAPSCHKADFSGVCQEKEVERSILIKGKVASAVSLKIIIAHGCESGALEIYRLFPNWHCANGGQLASSGKRTVIAPVSLQ